MSSIKEKTLTFIVSMYIEYLQEIFYMSSKQLSKILKLSQAI